jgi:hypothetical protein
MTVTDIENQRILVFVFIKGHLRGRLQHSSDKNPGPLRSSVFFRVLDLTVDKKVAQRTFRLLPLSNLLC